MAKSIRLTVPGTIASIKRQYGATIPVWKARRVFDSMEAAGDLCIQRVGNYRTVSEDDIGAIAEELQRLGWLHSEMEAVS